MNQNTKRLLIASGIAVSGIALANTLCYIGTKQLANVALNREFPQWMNRFRGLVSGSGKFFTEMAEELTVVAEKLERSNCETVEIVSHDGEKLVGHWHQCADAKRIIIAMHGWRSSWARDFSAISDFWHENDCNVLYVEQRGQNNSGGKYMGFGLIERYDCRDWISWVNQNRNGEGLPIYLAGISMGATSVLMAAGLNLPANVRGIIADCGFTSPHAIWKHVVEKNIHLPYGGLRSAMADAFCKQKIQIGSREYSTIDAMKHCRAPVLFIHGTDDHFVPIEMTYENYKACIAPKRLLVVPGAEHGMSYFLEKKGYEAEVRRFWEENDSLCTTDI